MQFLAITALALFGLTAAAPAPVAQPAGGVGTYCEKAGEVSCKSDSRLLCNPSNQWVDTLQSCGATKRDEKAPEYCQNRGEKWCIGNFEVSCSDMYKVEGTGNSC